MRNHFRWTLAAAALLAAGCDKTDTATAPAGDAAAGPAVPPPAGQDWTQTVAATPEGGFRMGNPDAKVKLVEYASLTCPHCAEFAKEATGPLEEQIRAGRLSWEYRSFILNGIDVVASLLARCQGPGPFFKLVEQVYAEQPTWVARFQTISPADQTRIQALPPERQPLELGRVGGLIQFFGARGVPTGRAEACLTARGALEQLEAVQQRATSQDGVTGTPSFVINGQPVKDVASWDLLKARIDTALAG